MRIGVYPGTFDPITNGHLDIIERGAKLFDKLYVVVPNNINKNQLFNVEERVSMIKEAVKNIKNVEVDKCDGLTVDYCKKVGAQFMLRGLRAVSDFEYELQLYSINHEIDGYIETIFIMSNNSFSFISSSNVKEAAKFNGDVSKFVPSHVNKALKEKYNK